MFLIEIAFISEPPCKNQLAQANSLRFNAYSLDCIIQNKKLQIFPYAKSEKK